MVQSEGNLKMTKRSLDDFCITIYLLHGNTVVNAAS